MRYIGGLVGKKSGLLGRGISDLAGRIGGLVGKIDGCYVI
jgi:hypothetical protein